MEPETLPDEAHGLPRACMPPANVEPGTARDLEAELLSIVRATFLELRHGLGTERVTLRSSLDHDLGFDSLARVELLLRIERAFDVKLGEQVLSSAETPRDLLLALKAAARSAGEQSLRAAAERPIADGGDAEVPVAASTLIEALDWHVRRHPERTQIVYSREEGEQPISYGQLQRQALALAAGLRARGLEPGQTVAIMLPTCPEYFYSYYGILLAGGVPVPIYPPARLSQIEEHVRRHAGILSNAATSILITVAEARPLARLLRARVPELREIVTAEALMSAGPATPPATASAGDIAFLQYTSGSTGNPKGVILSHANLLANIRAIGQAVEFRPPDVVVSWLPLYHDMGLISTWLASLYFGLPIVLMSPMAFLARPARWLWAIHRHRGTLSAAPNFAYELCVKRIEDADLGGLDLSSWRVAASGAEQVNPDTIERFQQRFGQYGFHHEAMMPVYGLAEATVGLLAPPLGRGPVIDRVKRETLVREGRAEPAAPDEAKPLRFAACGRPLAGHEVRIVDAAGRVLGERQEGRLEFRGPSATRGYYRNPEQTRHLFDGEWLDSGDRAYFAGGDFYLTGRVKDIVIRGGHHIYPDELEQAVGALPGVRKGCVAVFGCASAKSGTERLVVLAETRLTEAAEREVLRDRIVHATVDLLGEPPDEVVLAPPQTVMKTSSGKIRRSATRELYQSGGIGARPRAPWRQVAALIASAALPQLRRSWRRSAELGYAAYAWGVLAPIAVLAWLGTVASGSPARAWTINRAAARLFLRLAGIRLAVRGLQHLPRGRVAVLVVNHSSYLDGLVLLAALPGPYAFVSKKELLRSRIARPYLEHLGAEFVERFAIRQSVADAGRVMQRVQQGDSAIYFPEGTFRAAAGLLPFHLGAFLTAVRTGAWVVPVAIQGTRSILRGEEWLPRRGAVTVIMAEPLVPPPRPMDALSAAIRLRDDARRCIGAHCGEPDSAPAGGAGA